MKTTGSWTTGKLTIGKITWKNHMEYSLDKEKGFGITVWFFQGSHPPSSRMVHPSVPKVKQRQENICASEKGTPNKLQLTKGSSTRASSRDRWPRQNLVQAVMVLDMPKTTWIWNWRGTCEAKKGFYSNMNGDLGENGLATERSAQYMATASTEKKVKVLNSPLCHSPYFQYLPFRNPISLKPVRG